MEEEATVMCSNCERAIAESKAFLHEAYCLRNVVRCPKCNEPVDKNEMDEHEAEKHKLVSCQYCKQSMENTNLATHEGSCNKRPRMCTFCNCEVTGEEYTDHVYRCGSRTKKCPHCNKNILVRDYENHEPICQVQQFSGEGYQEHFPGMRPEEAKTEGTREKVSPYPSFNSKQTKEATAKQNPYDYLAESKKNKEPLEKKSIEQPSRSTAETKKISESKPSTHLPSSTTSHKTSHTSQKAESYQPSYNHREQHHVEEKKPSYPSSSNPTSYLKNDYKPTVSPNFNEVNIGYSNPTQISSTSTQSSHTRKDDIYSKNISGASDLSKYGISSGKTDLSKYGIPETKYGVSSHTRDEGLGSHSNKTSLPQYDVNHARVNQNLNAHKIFDNPKPTSDLGKHTIDYRTGVPHETHTYARHEITGTSQHKPTTHSTNYKPIVSTSSQKSHVDSYLPGGIDVTKSKPSYGIPSSKIDHTKPTGSRDLNQKPSSYLSGESHTRGIEVQGRKAESSSITNKIESKYQDPRSSNSYNQQHPKVDISQKYNQKESVTTSKHPKEVNSNTRQRQQEEAHRKYAAPSYNQPSQPTRNTREEYDEDHNEFIGGDEDVQRAIEESLRQKKNSNDLSKRSNPTRNLPSNTSTQSRSRPQQESSRPQGSNPAYIEDDEETQRAIQDSLKYSQKRSTQQNSRSGAQQASHYSAMNNAQDDELQRAIEESLKAGQNNQHGFGDTMNDEAFKRILEQSKRDK